MKKVFCALLFAGGLIAFLVLQGMWGAERKKTVNLMVWHTYVERMGDSFEALVHEFNDTAGAKEGIAVSVAVDAHAASLNEMLMTSVRRDPGARPCPDIALIYPGIAVELVKLGALADLGASSGSTSVT